MKNLVFSELTPGSQTLENLKEKKSINSSIWPSVHGLHSFSFLSIFLEEISTQVLIVHYSVSLLHNVHLPFPTDFGQGAMINPGSIRVLRVVLMNFFMWFCIWFCKTMLYILLFCAGQVNWPNTSLKGHVEPKKEKKNSVWKHCTQD